MQRELLSPAYTTQLAWRCAQAAALHVPDGS
ncbi:hypothetical protein [Pseudomonas fluvialis]